MSKHLLIVERIAETETVLSDWIANEYSVLVCNSVEDALHTMVKYSDTVLAVLLDELLPDGGAARFLDAVRQDRELRAIPVLAITQRADNEGKLRMLELGAMDVCSRPIVPAILHQRLQNLDKLRENTALRRAVEHDPLTGICNRVAFFRKTRAMLQGTPDTDYTLVYWDVEHFKVINELFGSEMGDRMLCIVADFLHEKFSESGTFCRLESDHFALCAPRESVQMDALMQELTSRIESLNINYIAALYAGVYEIADRGVPVDQMCDRAALAMRTVKGNYFTRYARYDTRLRETLLHEQEIVSEMNEALQEGQFCIYLQPLYSITSGDPISAEALVRWRHPTKGLISPGEFIPLFERNGFITKLDHYVWEVACQYLQDARAKGYPVLPVSVNVSRMNLYNPRLCDEIISLTKQYGLSPELLKLEITESAYTDNPRQLLSTMKRLQDYGFEILMDDFGSGYSSLNMLKDVPVNILKVDMRFLDDVENSGRAGNVMTSIIRMAKWLNMVVVAEGVETKAQLDFLRSIGCDKVQGFYFSKPLPVDEFNRLMLGAHSESSTRAATDQLILEDYDFDALWESNKQFNLLFNGMIGGMGVYELCDNLLEIIRVNAAYFELMGGSPQTLYMDNKDVFSKVHAEDREPLLQACRAAQRSHRVEQLQLRRTHQDGHLMWLDVKIRFLGNADRRSIFYFALNDVTGQKEFERAESLQQYSRTMLDAFDEVWELNYTDGTATMLYLDEKTGEYNSRLLSLHHAVNQLLTQRIHPEDQPRLASLLTDGELQRNFLRKVNSTCAIETRRLQKDGRYDWVQTIFYIMPDPFGKQVFLSCTRSIDTEKTADLIREENRVLQAKQREQERYRTIVEQTGTAAFEYDKATQTYYTSELFRQYAVSQESPTRLLHGDFDFGDYVEPADVPLCRQFFDMARSGKERVVGTFRIRRLDGSCPWCRVQSVCQWNEDGSLRRVICTINDINEQMLAELRLRAQREENARQLAYLTNLYLTVPCGIVQFTAEDSPQLIYFNKACQEIFGYPSKSSFAQALSDSVLSVIHPDDRMEQLRILSRCRATGKSLSHELRILCRNGSVGHLNAVTSLEQNSEGKLIMQSVFLDNTRHKEQEAKLKETHDALEKTTRELQQLLDNMPVGMSIVELDKTLDVKYINSNVYHMFGLQPGPNGSVTDEQKRLLLSIDGDRAERVRLLPPDIRRFCTDLHRAKRADGTPFWMRSYATLITRTGQPTVIYAVMADVTAQVALERAYSKQTELYSIMMQESELLFFDYDAESDEMVYSLRLPGSEARSERQLKGYLANLHHSKVLYHEHVQRVIQAIQGATDKQRSGEFELLADFGAGSFRWYRAFYRSVADQSGAIFRVIGRLEDIHEEKLAEEMLHQERIYRNAITSVALVVFEFNIETRQIKLISENADCQKTYYPFEDYLHGQSAERLNHASSLEQVRQLMDGAAIEQLIRTGRQQTRLQHRVLTRGGEWTWVETIMHYLRDKSSGQLHGVGYIKGIDESKKLEQKAALDPVTGLLNRATLEERIEAALTVNIADCYLFIFDIDDFKRINDTLGHVEGDRVLGIIGQTLKAHFRISDVVGRIGGDEFVALLSGAGSLAQIKAKAREVLAAIKCLSEEMPDGYAISASLGIAASPKDGTNFADLYRHADQALYLAKGDGKNAYRLYSGVQEE